MTSVCISRGFHFKIPTPSIPQSHWLCVDIRGHGVEHRGGVLLGAPRPPSWARARRPLRRRCAPIPSHSSWHSSRATWSRYRYPRPKRRRSEIISRRTDPKGRDLLSAWPLAAEPRRPAMARKERMTIAIRNRNSILGRRISMTCHGDERERDRIPKSAALATELRRSAMAMVHRER